MSVIDLQQLEELGGVGDEMLLSILSDFLNGLDAQAEELAGQIRAGDREGFLKTSHQLKGGARMAAFSEIGELLADWEHTVARGKPLPAETDVLYGLEAAGLRARKALEAACAEQRAE